MKIIKLSPSFYSDNIHLIEALDNVNGRWIDGKTRGYGVVIVHLNQLTFAIPLRTNIKHKAAYITVKSPSPHIKGKGLDYSKAVLITSASYLSDQLFNIPSDEHQKLVKKDFFITNKFEKYINRYIQAVKKGDKNILNSPEYRFTTLKNYHVELLT